MLSNASWFITMIPPHSRAHFVFLALSYKGHQCTNPLPVAYIVVTKEFDQLSFFMDDSPPEKHVQHSRISNKAKHIAQHELRAQAPVKESKVTRMSYPPIDARRYEKMRLCPPRLNLVVETSPSVQHRHGANSLADENHEEAGKEKHLARPKGRPMPVREEGRDNRTLHEGGGVSDGVGRPVRREQKAVDADDGGVSLGCGPKLQEVKGGEGEEEEGHAPDGAVREEQDADDADDADGEGDAQAKCAEGDSGERLWLAR
ncbi:hypothetical protein H0G86_005492 [Trichoderma simmonsii]|uniref:Uncharacterized protein n=1 Tax=Trichoderma simmonsii TaxID=1491479 RepID=A0A8G0LET3_9HYPO|nr:hypothetical protein H0G86_005492 [Trichoderma simmonsii]